MAYDKREKIMQLSLVLLFTVLLSGCAQTEILADEDRMAVTETGDESDIEILSFKTDKGSYSSNEEIKVLAVMKSATEIQNVTARLTGIKPHDHPYIDQSRMFALTDGENEISFSAKTPYCTSGCGGVYPGPYQIELELSLDEEVITASNITINLVSG